MSDVKEAIELIRAGKKDEARAILRGILKVDKDNEQAWMALASCARTKAELKQAVSHVLRLNPQNETAQKLATRYEVEAAGTDAEISEKKGGFHDPDVTLLAVSTQELPAVGSWSVSSASPPKKSGSRPLIFWLMAFTIVVAAFVGIVMLALLLTQDDELTANQIEATKIAETNEALQVEAQLAATQQHETILILTATAEARSTLVQTATLDQQEGDIDARNTEIVATNSELFTATAEQASLAATATQAVITPTLPPVNARNGLVVVVLRLEENAEIAVFDPQAPELINLTKNRANDDSPAWSPDGQWIAFISDRGDNHDIYIMRADGTDVRQVTDLPSDEQYPTWSPDGTQLAFASDMNGSFDIYTLAVDGGAEPVQLTDTPAFDSFPAWSSDNRLAFASNRDGKFDIYRMDSNGGNLQRLTETDADEFKPAWSSNSQQIAFIAQDNTTRDLYVINSDGTSLMNISDTVENEFSPSWAPDGRSIIYALENPQGFDIYRINPDGKGRRLIEEFEESIDSPDWALAQ